MFKIDSPGATADKRFTEGDPAAAVPATVVSADWLNAVQDELINVITDSTVTPAITPSKNASNQLVTAIKRLISAAAQTVSQATETVLGVVRLASLADLTAGTDAQKAVTPAGLAAARPALAQCRAWVSFDGTGTVGIRDGYNVSSITDRGVGMYTVNLTTPMANTNYAAVANHTNLSGSTNTQKTEVFGTTSNTSITTTSFFLNTIANGSYYDPALVSCLVFGRI